MTNEHDEFQAWILQRLEREARLRLFPSLHQLPEQDVCTDQGSWRRASGVQRCELCNLKYREHPVCEEWRVYFDSCDDRRLCNGDVVHL